MNSQVITEQQEIISVINECEVCFLGMVDGEMPYVLPFNFAYENNTIYLHSGSEGHKFGVLSNNNNVCLSFSVGHKMYHQHENVACSWGMRFKSVLAWGKVSFIDNEDEKIRILNIIMKKYSGRDDFKYSTPALNGVKIFKIPIDKITGKKRGY